ncbi:DinB family protein [Flagellimonas flava]|uniref:Uncharacterized damage-inducible protein DinB (Forms a four-helix bundle) n=1 Tax=Flagellimonas flava TaxID=570519 RepID=A0A1M5K5K2_9FLAO|nr:DinB family protein [Allomuricauda flava]SHG48117.1 Uncharacterized damage-inducible protein DinB (forms a four-helix bundle) [Allomuricauda flava]
MSAKHFLAELEQEFIATQNLLDIVPKDQLGFKPHEKAMSLGQLALHVATIPMRNLGFAKDGQVETTVIVQHPEAQTTHEILEAFATSKEATKTLLHQDSDTSWLQTQWKLLRSGEVIAEMPAHAFVRTFVLNHFVHHRGELTTYLRILNQKIPSIYGPTADVNPFA